jgi:predicted transglutaminase-like cysteine proteinase
MILISIQPFAFAPRKMLALLVGIVCLACLPCFASTLFLPTESTPYDRQMSRIRPVLLAGKNASANDVSLATVNQWMGDLRGIPYGYHMEWKTPAEVQSGEPADCKGKAVALYERMQARGATNVRLVIGKRAPTSRVTHAWLVWETSSGEFVLDPTFNWMACRSETIRKGSYLPYFAYGGTKKYRAASDTSLYANN